MLGEYGGLDFEVGGATGGGGGGEELGVFFGFGEAVGFAAGALLFVFFGCSDGSFWVGSCWWLSQMQWGAIQ
jgi:hypothetical protein